MLRLNAIGTLAATLAHELNQLLAAISNYAAGCTSLLVANGLQDGKVEEGLEAIARALERAGHINSKATNTGRIKGDRIQVQQVFVNLLRNAGEAAADGNDGEVMTIVTIDGDKFKLTVTDNGGGISDETQKDLFAFSESPKPGMGVGLSISRTIIESHGGTIRLEHTGSSGPSFSFSFPRV